jgi:hypothetical protein
MILLATEPSKSRPGVKHRVSVTAQVDCECEAARYRPMEYCDHALAVLRRLDAAKATRQRLEKERAALIARQADIEDGLSRLLTLEAR